jgi:DNA-binding NarL/FixJ family response regulator
MNQNNQNPMVELATRPLSVHKTSAASPFAGELSMVELFIVQDPRKAEPMIAILEGEPDLQVNGCMDDVDQALACLTRYPCSVMLVDYALPGEAALHLVRQMVQREAAPKVLITNMPEEEDTILHFFEEGASGYVSVDDGWADLVKKVRAVDEDEFIVSPNIAAAMMSRIADLKQLVVELDGGSLVRPEVAYADLTQREIEVLRLLGQDLSNQEIAEALTIELGTVKNHVHNLLRKLDVCSRKHAAQLARQMLVE